LPFDDAMLKSTVFGFVFLWTHCIAAYSHKLRN